MPPQTSAHSPSLRADFSVFVPTATRRSDFDERGQFSAAACCSVFDSAIHQFLLLGGGPEILAGAVGSHPLEAFCRFHRPVAFPELFTVGLRLSELGQASVRFEIAIFREGDEKPAATGGVTHVFVDRETGKPAQIPPAIRVVIESLRSTEDKGKPGDPTRRCG